MAVRIAKKTPRSEVERGVKTEPDAKRKCLNQGLLKPKEEPPGDPPTEATDSQAATAEPPAAASDPHAATAIEQAETAKSPAVETPVKLEA